MTGLATRGVDGEVLPKAFKGLLMPMGDGPLGRRVWDPWRAYAEQEPGGVTLGTDDHTESFCRVSGYLRNVSANARRLCACWNAFLGVPTEEIERLARERTGWQPPGDEDMWHHPDAPPTKQVSGHR